MNDLISRQAAIDAIRGAIFDFFDICDGDEESPMTYKDEQLLEINKAISGRIKQLPSAQPTEIVRCKGCYHYPSEYADCPMVGWFRNEHYYCSRAERRQE